VTRPDLSDPEQRLAYRRELQRVYRPARYGALALLVAALVGSSVDPAHQSLWIVLLVVGALLTFAVIIARARYHQRRMRE
jgi:general stress protein CsbA